MFEYLSSTIVGIIVFVLGTLFGSFSSVLINRIPQKIDFIFARSRCNFCHKKLSIRDLIPLLSFLLNKMRCRFCKKNISPIYPILETISGAVFVTIYYIHEFSAYSLLLYLYSIFMITTICIDIKHLIIPLSMQIFLIILVIYKFTISTLDIYNSISLLFITILIFILLQTYYLKIRKIDALGMGDVKIFCIGSLFLKSYEELMIFLFFSGILGILTGLIWRTMFKEKYFPFGPAIVISLFIMLLFPNLTYNILKYIY